MSKTGVLASVVAFVLALAPVAAAEQFVPVGGMLTAPETEGHYGPAFGASVALSADAESALVGAPLNNGFAGTAWAFTRAGAGWSEQGPALAVPPGPYAEENGWYPEFGRFMALSADDNTALIGGYYIGGAVWVFTRTGANWSEQTKLVECGEGAGQRCEQAGVSANGDVAVIPTFPAPRTGASGTVRVFTRAGSTWSEQAHVAVEAVGGNAGALSVALSADGETALVGVPDDHGGLGSVRVLTRDGSTWTQQAELTGEGEVGDGRFGASVAISADGNTAIVGAPADNAGAGAAWVFTRSGTTWAESETLTGGGESNLDHGGAFGTAVAVSASGNTALIGGPQDNEDIGAAWVFVRADEKWAQQGEKLTGAGEVGEGLFGEAVALSSGGHTALIGGPGFDEEGGAWTFASAGPPAFGRCVKVAGTTEGTRRVYHGAFTGRACLVKSPTDSGRYEWEPLAANVPFTLSGGGATLETASRTKLTCAATTAHGEYTGTAEVANLSIELSGCESSGHRCTSPGLSLGQLESKTLEGALGWEEEASMKVALDLYPVAHTGALLEYRCVGGAPVTVSGSVLVPVKVDEMESTSTLRYRAKDGIQVPEQLEGEANETLTASLNGEVDEPIGLKATLTLVNQEAVEINAVA